MQCARKWRHMIAITTSPAMISILVVVYVGIWCFYVLFGGWRQISERHFLFNLEETKMVKNSGVRHLIGISKYPLLDNIFCPLFENRNQERDL